MVYMFIVVIVDGTSVAIPGTSFAPLAWKTRNDDLFSFEFDAELEVDE